MKLAICIPHIGTIKIKTMFSIVRATRNLSCEWILLEREGSVLHSNREELVRKAIEEKCTHLLFVDTDMVFEKDAIERLIKRNKDIIGVNYHTKKLPLESTVKIRDKDEISEIMIDEQYLNGLWQVAAVATGFMLIKISVFEKLSHPWFFWESNDKGELVTGEDVFFCRKARQAGFDIWCDTTIKVLHEGSYLY